MIVSGVIGIVGEDVAVKAVKALAPLAEMIEPEMDGAEVVRVARDLEVHVIIADEMHRAEFVIVEIHIMNDGEEAVGIFAHGILKY